MIFFLINRFRRKKLRARESRQTAEDQRSIVGSIGYIAGNMGYMEGNLSSMDYSYGGAATHYPLWKPPSGYFPRGEAPPPYDEAVAISQAEALSAQCAAAAAAAQAAANQRVTMGMNTVELQNSEMSRRAQANQQMQQIQHHAQPQTAHNQLNHQAAHVVPTTLQTHVLAPQSQQQPNQSHQITQSTTNLINININSGGNITTIATGENHQPPYSLQDDNVATAGLMQQQSSALSTQQMQMQQQQQQLIAASTNGSNGQGTNGRVHIAQSNSICVQTMTPLQQQPQQPQQQQQQQQQLVSTQNNVVQSNQMLTGNSNTLTRQPQNLVMATNNDCGYKNCHLSSNNSSNTLSRRLQRTTEPLQQYVVDVEVNVGNGNSRGYHSLPPCQNTSAGDLEVIASPTQFSNTPSIANAISTPAIDQVSTNSTNQTIENVNHNSANNTENCTQQLNQSGHNTLPLQHNQTNKSSSSTSGGNLKNSSSSSSSSNSSKRYHRTMPRYYAVADPLSTRETLSATTTTNALNTANKSSKTETKLTANNIISSNSNNSSANSSLSSSKKPTCQCPVQHVPMSYMGSTQLTNAQNVSNNAFFTVLSNKLSSSANNSPSISSQQQQQHSQRLQTNSNTNSLNYQPRPKSSQSLAAHTTRDGSENISMSTNNTMKRSLNSHCNYEPKIATISTGELQNASANSQAQHHQQQQQQQQHHHHGHSHSHHHGHHSSLLPPPQHHDDSSPIVLGRVTKRSSSSSSGDRLRSASSGSTRSSVAESVGITSPAAAAYLNSKVDAYLNFAHGTSHHLKANDLINPALPPKLHKSLTNLKSTTSTITASPSSSSSATANSNTTNHRKNHNNNNNNNNDSATQQACNNINNSNTTSTNCNNFSSSSSPASSSAMNNVAVPMSNTTSVQTIYTLSKPHHSSLSPAPNTNTTSTTTNLIGLTSSSNTNSNLLHTRKSEHDHIMKITQQQPPSLTLPLSTTSTISSFTSSTSKINSSTFYPLQNNVTYTLPKNIGGKMSLNSTINSVVSKVPSVISLPSTSAVTNENINSNNIGVGGSGGGGENHSYHSNFNNQMLNDAATTTSAISKSTTLPKILRTKRDLHNNSTVNIITSANNVSSSTLTHHNSSANNSNLISSSSTSTSPSSSITTTNTSSNYAVSQCSMPAYPKQYTSMSSANTSATISSSTSSSTSAQQQQQNQTTHSHQPTNINMQTQTITSTLAANYCPEDSHLNTHNLSNTSHSSSTTFNTSSSSSASSSKQLPVCTTSKNCLNPKEHFLPNDTSLDDDYLSECENCKIAQSSKYYLDAEALASGPQETMTLQRKSMEECKEEPETGYYRISHTLPTNSKKNAPVKSSNREQWFSTIPAASSSSEEDINE